MKIPKKIKVGHIRYRVYRPRFGKIPISDTAIDPQLIGAHSMRRSKIWVASDKDMSLSQAQDTLTHELLHALFASTGIWTTLKKAEEDVVTRLSPALLQLIQDNPKLIAYLQRTK